MQEEILLGIYLLTEDERALHRLDKYEVALKNVLKFGLKDKFIELIEAAEELK